jgi:hypothetical protein
VDYRSSILEGYEHVDKDAGSRRQKLKATVRGYVEDQDDRSIGGGGEGIKIPPVEGGSIEGIYFGTVKPCRSRGELGNAVAAVDSIWIDIYQV